MPRLPLSPCLLLVVLALSGCSGAPSWVKGDWRFDHDRTVQEMNAAPATSGPAPGGFDLGKMMSGLTSMLGNQLVEQLNGMEVIINGNEVVTTIAGTGQARKYKVIERSADRCVVKLDDNTVETYYRSGDEIYIYGTGAAAFKVYLQRIP